MQIIYLILIFVLLVFLAMLLEIKKTYDKEEIIKIAKQIGTYEICIGPEVCDCLGPKNPATRSDLKEVLEEEAKL